MIMAMDVYDQLASAAQAAYAEKEVSEEARQRKIEEAFRRAGFTDEWNKLTGQPHHTRQEGKPTPQSHR
jgi:hypothetical protein